MSQLYIGNIDSSTTIQDLVREFEPYGEIRSVKIPRTLSVRKFAFVEFKDRKDALIAIQSWNFKFNWRVNLSNHSISNTLVGNSGSRTGISSRATGFCGDLPSDCSSKVTPTCGGFGHFSLDCTSAPSEECFFYGEVTKNKGVEHPQRIKPKKNKVASTPKRKPVRPPSPPWLELPEDITEKVLRKLGPVGILWAAQYVCTMWRKICRDPSMWRVIDMWKLGDIHSIYSLGHMGLQDVFVLAVDLGQGQVTEINMDYFGHDYYLEYTAKRCGNLRCLRLAFCEGLAGRTLSKAVKRFPLLEELHLQCVPVRKRFIEAIGPSCPMLKKFAMNRGCRYEAKISKRSQDALAIAKSMPELHHLQLFGNMLTNEVLDTILNDCPKLESLDLRQCYNLYIEGELGRKCAEQIKILRLPHDPTNDYEWLAESATWENYQKHESMLNSDDYDSDEYRYDLYGYDKYDSDYSNPDEYDSDDSNPDDSNPDEYDSDDCEDHSSDPHLSHGGNDDSGFPVV